MLNNVVMLTNIYRCVRVQDNVRVVKQKWTLSIKKKCIKRPITSVENYVDKYT